MPPTVVAAARREIDEALRLFERLISLHPTPERESLYASALKRLAMIELVCANQAAARRAVAGMAAHYRRAMALARATPLDLAYSAMGCVVAELWRNGGRSRARRPERELLDELQRSLESRPDVDFWTSAARIELEMFRAVSTQTLVSRRTAIVRQFSDLHRRAGAPWLWGSIHEQAAFVLQPYLRRVKKPAEQDAGNDIVETLRRFATPIPQ
jgi:hypothetical protein